jgi:hypothetical protein
MRFPYLPSVSYSFPVLSHLLRLSSLPAAAAAAPVAATAAAAAAVSIAASGKRSLDTSAANDAEEPSKDALATFDSDL